MTKFRKFDIVELIDRTEIKPLFYIDKNVLGVVMDDTCIDYYLVRFEGHGGYWVSGSKLKKYKGGN